MWQWREEPPNNPAPPHSAKQPWQWREVPFQPPFYLRLALAPSATHHEIRQAYRRLAHRLHPDLRPGEEQALAAREMADLNAAYQTLCDPARRAAYDRAHGLA